SLLAILKAGGAYVPFDPSYPRDRISFMVSDTRPAVLLTHQALFGDLVDDRPNVVAVDREVAAIARYPASTPESDARPESLAYIIYTSGSTGRPKGAMNSHRAICNRLLWMQQEYGLTGSDRILQ